MLTRYFNGFKGLSFQTLQSKEDPQYQSLILSYYSEELRQKLISTLEINLNSLFSLGFLLVGSFLLCQIGPFSGTAQAKSTQPTPPQESHPEISLEADYAEAVFEFTNRRYSKALEFLNALLQKKSDHIQALELKALTLKTLRNDADSLEVYEKLLAAKPEEQRAPYHFELGTIYFRQKRFEEAKDHLEKSIQAQFNLGVSHFFLATAEFQTQELKKALRNFKSALEDVPTDLQVACHYYMGMIHAQMGYGPGASNELLLARDQARDLENSPRFNSMVQDLSQASSRALEPYNRSTWMKNISFSLQEDGNVSSVSSIVTPEAAAGKVSLKSNLGLTLGYAASPLLRVQPVIIYRLSLNKNFNGDARDYEFTTHTLSGYFTYNPLSTTQYGTKVEGNYGFQNRSNLSTNESTYRPFLQSFEVSPFLKTAVIEHLQLTTELVLKSQTFPNDSIGIDRRSGNILLPRVSAQFDTLSHYWNPMGSLGYEFNQTLGSNQRSRTLAIDFSNTMKLPQNRTLTLGASMTWGNFSLRIPETRSDRSSTLRASFQAPLTSSLLLTTEATYTANSSNLSSIYSYTKPTASIGLNYHF